MMVLLHLFNALRTIHRSASLVNRKRHVYMDDMRETYLSSHTHTYIYIYINNTLGQPQFNRPGEAFQNSRALRKRPPHHHRFTNWSREHLSPKIAMSRSHICMTTQASECTGLISLLIWCP